jgi:hypothetical protein
MFRAQPGFAGVLFAAHATERDGITGLEEHRNEIRRLSGSQSAGTSSSREQATRIGIVASEALG